MVSYKLGVLASHPIQYQAPLFRELAKRCELRVYFAHRQTAEGQAQAGFGVAFDWDVDLLGGYPSELLDNRARRPDVGRFGGCDTPGIGTKIRDGGFDAFLVMGWYLKSYWQAVRACRRWGVPVLVRGDSQLGTPRGGLKRRVKALVYPRLLAQFDAHLYVGQRNRDYLRYYGVPADRLYFSPHFVDNRWFAERVRQSDRTQVRAGLGVGPAERLVLFVGKLIEKKRPLDLVQALALLKHRGRGARGVFVGAGPLEDAVGEGIARAGAPAEVIGFRNQSALPALYAAADVLVLPSDGGETWGLVVNEALACGTPVVVSDAVGCAPDLVAEGITGAAYPVGDVQALADAIEKVLACPPAPGEIQERLAAYSPQAAADGVMQAMRDLRRAGATP